MKNLQNYIKILIFIAFIAYPTSLLAKRAAIIIDYDSKEVLFEINADTRNYPASLAKIMTLYIVFDYLHKNRLSWNSQMKVSKIASSRSPSKLYLEEGSYITVENAVLALVIKSANDVAAVVAEHISKTEKEFAKLMTAYARNIGMKNTTFKNASGLPNRAQMTTARDIATAECTPQHLTLVSPDCYDQLGTYAQMNPPIREITHQRGLWAGISDGTVTAIGSDHAPHTREEKDEGYPNSPSGMPGVQTLLPIMLDHVNNGRLNLNRLVQLTSSGPAKLYNASSKGKISIGFDADLTLVDLKRQQTISQDWLASKCGWSPYLNKKVTGWPVATILRGKVIMQDAQLIGDPIGEVISFG